MSDYTPLPGDIGLCSTKGIVGFLIQLGTFSKMNHSFIYEGEGIIIEATPRLGVKRSPVTAYSEIVWSRHKIWTDAERAVIVAELQSHIGAKYFFKDFAVIGLNILHVPVPKFLTNGFSKSTSFICSQLSTHCWRKAGYDYLPSKDEWFVKPSDQAWSFWFM